MFLFSPNNVRKVSCLSILLGAEQYNVSVIDRAVSLEFIFPLHVIFLRVVGSSLSTLSYFILTDINWTMEVEALAFILMSVQIITKSD